MLGGALYIALFRVTILIHKMSVEQTEDTFLGSHASIHMLDVTMFALLALGAVGVYAH